MTPRRTIKARMHHGANSLDLTIPTELRREHRVEAGDVFSVTAAEEGGELAITYRRVFRNGSRVAPQEDHSGNTRV